MKFEKLPDPKEYAIREDDNFEKIAAGVFCEVFNRINDLELLKKFLEIIWVDCFAFENNNKHQPYENLYFQYKCYEQEVHKINGIEYDMTKWRNYDTDEMEGKYGFKEEEEEEGA